MDVEGEDALVIEGPGSVRRARRFVSEQLAAHGLRDLAGDAEVVASELITNALLHGGAPAKLVLRVSPPRARVEVRDRSRVTPVRPHPSSEGMTGRGLHLVERLVSAWGVSPTEDGKSVWAEFGYDHTAAPALWDGDLDDARDRAESAGGEPLYTISLGNVPTGLLLDAKSHVDDLVREFTLAASGAYSGATSKVPPHLAELIEVVVHRFSDARHAIRRQALAAKDSGADHVALELRLPASAAKAGEDYLRGLDAADAYCRAARLLTLESPPQHRVFRRWYVEELVGQLRRAALGEEPIQGETFEQRLLREIDWMAEAERRAARAARLHEMAFGLAAALTPQAVARAALNAGVSALGASGGAVLLATTNRKLAVPGTVGYDAQVVARLEDESPAAELPAATALRTGEEVWLESPAERDTRFPQLAGLEPGTVSMLAVPLETRGRRLGALRLSFTEARLFDDDERRFVRAMAAQTAQALDRAELSAARADGARRLQQTLLPPTLPNAPGIGISAAYRPLTASLDVGGDFYDVWECGGGRLGIAIGDVCGHGPEAAAVTGLIRHTLRALTMTSTDAAAIMRRLNRALCDALASTDAFSTVAFGFIQSGPDGCVLDLASGGHPGPVVVRSDRGTETVELGGSLLGVLDDLMLDRCRIRLQRGDELILVTDGVTDARNERGEWFGIEGVVAASREAYSSGVDIPEAVTHAVLGHGGGRLHDDVAVLALRCTCC